MPQKAELNADELILQHRALAYSIAQSYRGRGLDPDDLKQEALIGLLGAISHYSPDKGTKFSTYAVFWIKKQILEALKTESSNSLQAEELSEELLSSPTTEPREDESLVLPAGFPALEESILRYSLEQDLSLREIAQKLQISPERCKQLRQKALRRLRSIRQS